MPPTIHIKRQVQHSRGSQQQQQKLSPRILRSSHPSKHTSLIVTKHRRRAWRTVKDHTYWPTPDSEATPRRDVPSTDLVIFRLPKSGEVRGYIRGQRSEPEVGSRLNSIDLSLSRCQTGQRSEDGGRMSEPWMGSNVSSTALDSLPQCGEATG